MGGSISDDDYPAAAVRGRVEGTTTVLLQIGENGRVTGCQVARSAGHASLDSTTCALLQRRFRYRAATRNGRAVPSTLSQTVRWQMPDLPVISVAQGRLITTAAARAGSVTACSERAEGEAFAEMQETCSPTLPSLIVPGQLGAAVPAVTLTHALQLLPEGETDRLPPLPGAPVWEEVHILDLAPNGAVSGCSVTAQRGQLPPYAQPRFHPLCDALRTGRWFAPAAGVEPRRVRIRSSVYQEIQAR
jgi:TonB family protein